jgi:Zn-dependent protease
VFSAEPPRTQFDLSFQVFGFPVRVHPLFWLMALLTGFRGGDSDGIVLLTWFFAVFVSILIHELGHTFMIRRFGREAHIVLYMMGGLAIEGRPSFHEGSSPWSFESYSDYRPRSRTPGEQIIISAAGPIIQLLLAALVVGLVYASGGSAVSSGGVIPLPMPMLGGEMAKNENLHLLAWFLIQINIMWALLNLIPVLPLDGGQIALQILTQRNPWSGMQHALWLSVISGGAMAVFALTVLHQQFTMLLFASLAVSNYLTLQQTTGRRPW